MCADHPNQASAQRANDTRDGDGDGIYSETLPCPCLPPDPRAGGGGGKPKSKPRPRRNRPRKARPRAHVIDTRIIDIVDGDTVKVRAFAARRRFYTVRILGTDTPEGRRPGVAVECGGREATSNAWRLGFRSPVDTDGDGLLDDANGRGRSVTLTTDPTRRTSSTGSTAAWATSRSAARATWGGGRS